MNAPSTLYSAQIQKSRLQTFANERGFKIQDLRFKVQGSRLKIQDSRFKIEDSRLKIQD